MVDDICHPLVTHAAQDQFGVGFVVFNKENDKGLPFQSDHNNLTDYSLLF
jgi:hypothetical protein